MTRILAVLFILIIVYFIVRNVIRGFLRGLNLGNKNVQGSAGSGAKENFKDVKDAEFKDITDET